MELLRGVSRTGWDWYERHHAVVLAATVALFLLQLFHLYWLFADVILAEFAGTSLFPFPREGLLLYVIIDYTEIPVLVSASIHYFSKLRARPSLSPVVMLLLLNSQWAHILWITDEVVVGSLGGGILGAWPLWLAWVAIAIDYAEVPVILDTLRDVWLQRRSLRTRLALSVAQALPRFVVT
ncbi:MAG: hypothetical protein CL878_08770 [Dehalococcoidia bacterium]|nr:hypothetical protein [Dehalococcoidia bacterium]